MIILSPYHGFIPHSRSSTQAPQVTDTATLSVPQHVELNHLYCTAIKDGMMVLGITQVLPLYYNRPPPPSARASVSAGPAMNGDRSDPVCRPHLSQRYKEKFITTIYYSTSHM